MEKQVFVSYDKDGDMLDIIFGKPRKSYYEDIGNEVSARIDEKTKKVVGYSILNFTRKFGEKPSGTIVLTMGRKKTHKKSNRKYI